MATKLFVLALCLGLTADAATGSLDLRHTVSASDDDLFAYSLAMEGALLPPFQGRLGLRLANTWRDIAAVIYSGDVKLPITSFFGLRARLSHALYTSGATTLTHAAGQAEIEGSPFPFLGLFGSFGWFERWSRIDNTTVIPSFLSSFREHDFMGSLGIEVRPFPQWRLKALVSTFEEIEIYNLNNPFCETRLSYAPGQERWVLSGYFRYKVGLGFGRWDELAAGITWTVTEWFASDS